MRGGVGELVDALGARLGGSVHLRSAVKQVRRVGDHWHVAVDGTAGLLADHVVVAGPAHIGAKLFAETDEVLPGLLAGVPYGSAATVFLAFHVAEIPRKLDATGYLVPASLGRPAAAATWVSSKWPSRAPDGHALVRVFFGKSRVDDDDAQLIDLARVELRQTLGVMAEPELAHVARFREASPSPRVGHVELMAKLRARAAERGGLHFAGSSFDGTGISDCVRQGEAIAAAITGPAATAGSDRPATVR
jgi:oxygen-dependent protoporphyrinogen oxidase